MKRPILMITLGFILGIVGGLYCNIVPFLLIWMIIAIYVIKNAKIKNNHYMKSIQILIPNHTLLMIMLSALLGYSYLAYCNHQYELVYSRFSKKEIIATVVSSKKETEYKEIYKIRLEKCSINFLLRVAKNKEINLQYGDKIKINGEFSVPEEARNYVGFNYKQYLKTKKIYGIFESDNIRL